MVQLESTWLVQRLEKPHRGNSENPFTFGGGLVRGGINKEVYGILNKIFTFDYMGAAEFEFGAVPKALDKIVDYFNNGHGVCGELNIEGVQIYYLTDARVQKETEQRIRDLAVDPFSKKGIRTKERVGLHETIKKKKGSTDRWLQEYLGWIELDNGFIFFSDKEAFENFRSLLQSE